MAISYTGVRVISTTIETIDQLYKNKIIKNWNIDNEFFPNQFLILKVQDSKSAICRMIGNDLVLINDKIKVGPIKPRNKEQFLALDALLDDSVTVNVMTGRSGTGKTLLSLAVALHKSEEKKYSRIILTRPMSFVGKYDLGALPGTVAEKFGPYLGNFQDNLAQLGGKDIEHAIERFNIECIPIQLMRGRSFINSFIIADEIQILSEMELMTIGTRVGDGSKIVLLGDLQQRDEKISKTSTGLYKFINSSITKNSKIVSAIELLKVERSATSLLFTEVFEKVGND